MARPLGITILGALVVLAAFVMFLIGIAGFIVGLAGLIPGSPIPGTTLLLNGLLYVIIGIVLGVAGFGLMRLRPWAWGLAVLATLVTLVYLGYNVWQDSNAGKDITLTAIVTLVIVGAVFVYLLGVARAFRRPQTM
ncbi:MAG TPA: hypothetical protein VEO96_07755 [Thermoplasmata archaeon]|nr:hypothetical protein [Thermoplasmata archaeon]